MADISDVEQALADLIAGVVYPNGFTQASIAGVLCRIYRGWPNAAALSSDLSASAVNITIAHDAKAGQTTTRYLPEWQFNSQTPTLTATVLDQTILVGGVASAGNVIGALINGNCYSYRVANGDTPNLVASNLCAAMRGSFMAAVTGSSIRVPGAGMIVVRVVCDSMAYFESRRQQKPVRVVFWCPDPTIRDSLTAAIDLSLAQTSFLSLPDDTSAHIAYQNTETFDQAQNALLYRRDLVYCVEYPTITNQNLPSLLFGAAGINGRKSFG